VDDVSERTVTNHYGWLSKKNLDPQQHNKKLGFFRRFVNWLWTEHLIEQRPRNLLLKSHRKKIRHKEIRTFENVKSTIDALSMPHKLWGLLCLNCGMSQADLGTASWKQIDQTSWTLTRRRAKTGDNPDTPTVRYKLWDDTIKLLRKLPHRQGLLFKTTNGSPMYETRFDSKGEPKIKDLFSTYWRDLSSKPAISLGKFRSIAATAMKKDKLYRPYVDYFLAHAATKLSDLHYGREDDVQFFEALAFVRKQVLR
jgi:integrase